MTFSEELDKIIRDKVIKDMKKSDEKANQVKINEQVDHETKQLAKKFFHSFGN